MNIEPRSHLYALEPVESYSSINESAGSYVSRLAIEHCVSTQDLFDIILNSMNEEPRYIVQREYSSILYFLNGMGHFAKKWIEALEKLTGRPDLKSHALLNWEGIIRPNELIRKYKTWCPQCLTEWKSNSNVIFEPLLWNLSQAKICPKHRIYLLHKCPNAKCNHLIPTLGSRSRPGYCSYCDTWLGDLPSHVITDNHEDLWIAEILQEMMIYNHDPAKATVEINGQRALRLFDRRGAFQLARSEFLASIFGVHPTTINRWKRGESPTLSILLAGCYLLQRSPFAFDPGEINEEEVGNFISKNVCLSDLESGLLSLLSVIWVQNPCL